MKSRAVPKAAVWLDRTEVSGQGRNSLSVPSKWRTRRAGKSSMKTYCHSKFRRVWRPTLES